jgi:hypothetical protein
LKSEGPTLIRTPISEASSKGYLSIAQNPETRDKTNAQMRVDDHPLCRSASLRQ